MHDDHQHRIAIFAEAIRAGKALRAIDESPSLPTEKDVIVAGNDYRDAVIAFIRIKQESKKPG